MAAASSATRRSTREARAPINYADEQAALTLAALEQRDMAAALRLSLAAGWDGDDETAGEIADESNESTAEEEEEENKSSAVMQMEDEWTANITAVDIPLPRLRSQHRTIPSADTSAMELLQLFLSPPLIREFVQHTNAAAPNDWRQTTVEELYAFIGAHIFMGIDRLPQTELYWSKEFRHDIITSAFTRDRFKQLLRYFRVAPADDGDVERDPLPHIRPLVERLNAVFAANYIPSRSLVLDETMVAFKGRSRIKQYMPMKPHKWGYKIYCLASDNYILRFEIYEGRVEEKSATGATYDTVLRMIEPYQGKEHILFADSWFSSPTLLDALKQRGIRYCGSVRSNRRGLPKISDNDIKALKRGEWLQRQKGDTALAVWKDEKVVRVLYNHCSPNEVASLDRWNDSGGRVSIGCPRAIRDYFFQSRSVDVINQLHYGYLMGRKAKRCWPRLAWWLLDACILNAFQLWSIGRDRPDQLTFRRELMRALLEQHRSERRVVQLAAQPSSSIALAKDHYSERTDNKRECVVCSHRPSHRAESYYVCHTCKVHLCVGACFGQYHAAHEH